jgi:hypothetical protein
MIFIDNKYTKWYNNIISTAKSRISITGYTEIHHIIPRSMDGSNDFENLVKLTAREHFICHLLLTKMTYGNNKTKMNFAFWCLCNRMKNNILTINSRFYQKAKENFATENSIMHKGKILSQETKDKISKAHLGKKLTEDHKAKINPTGRKHTDETKSLLSRKQIEEYATGERIHGRLGKILSQETKDKISIGNTGKKMPPISEKRRQQISEQFSGTTQTAEHVTKRITTRKENGYYKDKSATIKKMSESAKNKSKIKCHCGKECSPSNFKRWHGNNCKLSKSYCFLIFFPFFI